MPDMETARRDALNRIIQLFEQGGVKLSQDELETVEKIYMSTFDLIKLSRGLRMDDEPAKVAVNTVMQALVNAMRILRMS